MRRLMANAAFFLALSLVPISVHAQHGGGGHGGSSGGAHASSGGGRAGFSSGRSGFPTHSSFSSSSAAGGSHFSSLSGSHFPSGASNSGRYGYHNGNGHYGYYNGRYYIYGYGRGPYLYSYYGYPYYGGYDPYWDAWWWGNGQSSYDEDAMNQRQMAAEMNQQNLEEQDWLRQQNDQDAFARPPRPAQPVAQSQPENDPATVLVFRDQHQREIHNYAIADGILYNFVSSRTERIPLAVVDIPATIKANDDRGVGFHLPPPNEGQ